MTYLDKVANATRATVPALTVLGDAPAVDHQEAVSMAIGGLIGAFAGAFLWKRHRWLGGLGGLALGGSVSPLSRGQYGRALLPVAAAGAGVYGSLHWKKHRAWGYVLPSLAVGLVGAPMVKR